MSIENEDFSSVEQSEERKLASSKQPKISYTREFLLSLSELEVCRRLPSGFDQSLLSKFNDTSHGFQDRARIPGSSTLHGFRRNDYSSSPPGRGDVGNFSRGSHRWDSHSSAQSDTDSQSDKDSDSGRHFGSQYRRSWRNAEHDGLLGSGSFPRPPGCGAVASVPRFHANDQHQLSRSNDQLSRSNDPYHPPRPYKAVPYARREDSYNDETFGSSEFRSEDIVEEERKRRAEFEMMRKEQQKALQEKLKLNADKPKPDPLSEMIAMDNSGDAKPLNGLEKPVIKPVMQCDSAKISSSSQTTHTRPLVPPGFSNTSVDKNPASKSLTHSDPVEVVKLEFGAGNQGEEASLPFSTRSGLKVDSSVSEDSCEVNEANNSQSLKAPNFSSSDALQKDLVLGIGSEHITGNKIKGEVCHSTSILEKIFSGALTLHGDDNPHIIQDDDTKMDDVWSPKAMRLSKFAQWFPEEEKKPKMEDVSSGKSSDLLSLIVGEKFASIVSDTKVDEQVQPSESNLGRMASDLMPKAAGTSEPSYCINKPEAKSQILTCEDLEQSLLSEAGETNLSSRLNGEGFGSQDVEKEHEPEVDNSASNHLLSLLLKGSSSASLVSLMSKESSTEPCDFEVGRIGEMQGNLSDENVENLNITARKLTLEALFGTAFMNELHSVDQPVSIQRNSAGSGGIDAMESVELPFLMPDDGALNSSVNEVRTGRMKCDDNISSFSGVNHPNLDKIERNWLSLGNSHHLEVDSLKMPSELQAKHGGYGGSLHVRLPEEDSLISVSDPLDARSSTLLPDLAGNPELLSSSSKTPTNVAEKLAALGASVKDDRSIARGQEGGTPFFHGPYDFMRQGIPFPNIHTQPSPEFNPPSQMNHERPVFHPLDSHPVHMDSQLSFMGPEGIRHLHDGPPLSHQQFSDNMPHPPFRPHNAGLPEFDRPVHPMLHRQMHMPNNLPPHMLQGFPSGSGRLPPHLPVSNPAGFIQEQGFLFSQRQSNLGGPGIPLPGPEHGGMDNQPPEAFQRLLERELQLNPKQIHPPFPAGGGGRPPMYGHELDAGFWYR